jgi:hypothetical protein
MVVHPWSAGRKVWSAAGKSADGLRIHGIAVYGVPDVLSCRTQHLHCRQHERRHECKACAGSTTPLCYEQSGRMTHHDDPVLQRACSNAPGQGY